jgi:hypothetical protein
MPTPTETWQDRRGMFQRGKDVHQPGRKLSNQFGDPLAGRRSSIASTGSGTLEKTESIEEPGAQRRRVSYILSLMVCCGDDSLKTGEDTICIYVISFVLPAFQASRVFFGAAGEKYKKLC